MSTLSSVSKGQTAKTGWKSCIFSRHLMRTASGGGHPDPQPCSPLVPLCDTHFSSSPKRYTAVLLVAGK